MPHRIGLIGLGTIARTQHLPAIAENAAFELIGAASLEGEFSQVPVFRSHVDLLAMPGLEAVVICTPPQARLAVAADALAAGKHVLLEKPPTATCGGLAELQRLAARHQRLIYTAWHSQYNETVNRLRAFLAGRDVENFEIVWNEDFRRYHPGQQWIWQAGGFGVVDAGINVLSILSRIMPATPFVTGAELMIPANAQAPITAHLRFGNGTAVFDWDHQGEPRRELTLTTADGHRVELSNTGGRLVIDGEVVIDAKRAEYRGIYAHFDKLLREGSSFVDAAPLQMAADAFLVGRRVAVAAIAA